MDPISNADRFVALLRQKLAERAKAQDSRQRERTEGGQPAAPGGEAVRSVVAGAARAGADDRRLRRTIVEQLLADRFGATLANEPNFQQVVSQVAETMAADTAISALLDEVMTELRR